METWDAIRSRRDVRSFGDRPLSDDDLDRILEAGRRAPSSRNWQPWDFVVVTDRKQLVELAEVWQGAGHVARSAATIALIAPIVEGGKQQIEFFDLGQAAVSMMIAAADLGIGSGHAAVRDQEVARRVLGFPEDRFCAHLIPLGDPADRPLTPLRRPDRRPFDEVVHRGRW
ncbi:MAG: nitroreductase family protein [Gaiellaceae bacterium]